MQTLKFLILFFILVFIFSIKKNYAQNIPQPYKGKIIRFEKFNSKYVNPRNIDVWLPENYQENQKYAVLYMNDGQMLFDANTTWNKQEWKIDETLTELEAQKKIKSCIVVGIWNNDKLRHSEYFPQKPFKKFLTKAQQDSLMGAKRNPKQSLFGGEIISDNYLKFLVKELKPFIDKKFSTHKKQKNTFIGGASMGGLISMYAICEYPNVFGGAICMSTHWIGIHRAENNPIPNAFMQYLAEKLPNPKNHLMYFDTGTATLDALYPPFQQKADVILEKKGFVMGKNLITKVFEGDDHSEKSWQKRLHIPLVFLLGER